MREETYSNYEESIKTLSLKDSLFNFFKEKKKKL